MGEYLKVNGVEIKIGICEDLYYIRFDDLKRAYWTGQVQSVPGNGSGADYLDEKNGFRYRFPFPEEDGLRPGGYADYNAARIVGVSPKWLHGLNVAHDDIVTHVSAGAMGHAGQGSGYGVNLAHKCPGAADFVRTCSAAPGRLPVAIMQQKQVDGQLWTVCACSYCGSKFRLDKAAAVGLCREIAVDVSVYPPEDSRRLYWYKMIKRILRGYFGAPARGIQ